MTADVDIISMDRELRQKFLERRRKIPELEDTVRQMKELISRRDIADERVCRKMKNSIKELRSKIDELESDRTLQLYIVESAQLIDAYKKILNKPLQMSFMGPLVTSSTEKDDIIKRFLKTYKIYAPQAGLSVELSPTKTKKTTSLRCSSPDCDSTDFSVVDLTNICQKCFCVQSDLTNPLSSYADIDRINISSKYLYCRRIHFRDCILQFQGRQNVSIDKSVYEALENEFDKHHLLIGDSQTPVHIRFSKITKEHITIFLKELRLSKHYENVQLIHYNLTGKPPPDISHLEAALLQDFEKLTNLYDEIHKKSPRKNFINTQYILYQLLRRHKYDCDANDFSILKTSERRDWHHRTCRELFAILNWNFSPL
jgi:hypothetical protein